MKGNHFRYHKITCLAIVLIKSTHQSVLCSPAGGIVDVVIFIKNLHNKKADCQACSNPHSRKLNSTDHAENW